MVFVYLTKGFSLHSKADINTDDYVAGKSLAQTLNMLAHNVSPLFWCPHELQVSPMWIWKHLSNSNGLWGRQAAKQQTQPLVNGTLSIFSIQATTAGHASTVNRKTKNQNRKLVWTSHNQKTGFGLTTGCATQTLRFLCYWEFKQNEKAVILG